MSKLSRRGLLTRVATVAAAAAPVVALPALAEAVPIEPKLLASPAGADSVLALVERFRSLQAARHARLDALEAAGVKELDADAEVIRLSELEDKAYWALSVAQPSTVQGSAALLRCAAEQTKKYEVDLLQDVAPQVATFLDSTPAPIAPQVIELASEPTPIAKLWRQYEALEAKDNAEKQKCDRLMQEVRRRAGAPDPAIRPSQAVAFGIRSGYVDHYIEPLGIQIALDELGVVLDKKTRGIRRLPLNKRQLAQRRRLKEMLRLSRPYQRKVHRLSKELGIDAANDRIDALTERECDLANRILKLSSATVNDLEIKFKIREIFRGGTPDHAMESIVRDMRRLMKRPSALTKMLGEA
jgi:hypothetical protein